jgi:hypothetical protein
LVETPREPDLTNTVSTGDSKLISHLWDDCRTEGGGEGAYAMLKEELSTYGVVWPDGRLRGLEVGYELRK